MVNHFHVAITGDFLGVDGRPAYGNYLLPLLDADPFLRYRILTDQSPPPKDPDYWHRFYALKVSAAHIAGVNGLVVLRPWITRETFANGAGELVVIGRSGAGYDKIDLQACTDNDVALFNAPLGLQHSTASSALLFMLALVKRLPEQEKLVRAGRWDLQSQTTGGEIQGRTLGIIGLGNSGRELARLVAPFDMRVLAFSPHADPRQALELGVRLTSLEDVLREADFVSMHCRLTAETKLMLKAQQLALMKGTAFFINVSRGELVDPAALIHVLQERKIAGAGLDVFPVEPLPLDDPLLRLDNVILTPHWNASTTDVWRATGKALADGMLRAARGQVPEHVVNREVLIRPEFQMKLARWRNG